MILGIFHSFPIFLELTLHWQKTLFSIFLSFRDPNDVQMTYKFTRIIFWKEEGIWAKEAKKWRPEGQNTWAHVMATCWWTLRGRLWCRQQKFSLENLPKVINPVGLDDQLEGWWCWLPKRMRSVHQRGICTDTNQNFAQHETERLSISPVLQKQRVKRMVWKTVGIAANNKE